MLIKMYQAKCSDAYILTIGETPEGNQVLFSIRGDTLEAPLDFTIEAETFTELCDLKYRLDFSIPKAEKPYLAHVA